MKEGLFHLELCGRGTLVLGPSNRRSSTTISKTPESHAQTLHPGRRVPSIRFLPSILGSHPPHRPCPSAAGRPAEEGPVHTCPSPVGATRGANYRVESSWGPPAGDGVREVPRVGSGALRFGCECSRKDFDPNPLPCRGADFWGVGSTFPACGWTYRLWGGVEETGN